MSRTNRFTLTGIAALVAGTLLPPVSAQSRPTDDNALEARVKHLEDLEEIRMVLTNYGRFLDARDFFSYSHLFAKDGEWIGGLGKVQGPAAIQAFMEKASVLPTLATIITCYRTSRSTCTATPPQHGRDGPL